MAEELPELQTSVTTEVREDARVISVRGELDLYSTPQLATEVDAVPADASVVLDLTQVGFMDSTALGAILLAARRIGSGGGRLALVASDPATTKLISMVGIDRVVAVHDSVEQALAS